tara:strand:+ start:863 stop:1786 length:924 start_codon:yes stop_codon:yes gene_type:complete
LKTTIKTLLSEALLIKSFETDLNEVLIIFESEEPVTFEWDIAKERLDKATQNIRTSQQAELFLKTLIDKVKNLPKQIKMRLIRYSVVSLLALLSITGISKAINNVEPEIKSEILTIVKKHEKEPEVKIEEPKTPTKSSDSLINFIKHEEGDIIKKGEPVLKPYKLGDGMITVGWGHAEKIRKSKYAVGEIIDREEAEKLLSIDLKKAESNINDILSGWSDNGIEYNINQEMYDAMVSMTFNMGRSGFRRSRFIQLVKKGKYEKAKEEIMNISKRLFNKYPGLKDRRQKESNLFAIGLKKLNDERINS